MGKKRNTAKTGDKALYGSREKLQQEANNKKSQLELNDVSNDQMYNEVDRFHNDEDQNFIQLENEENERNKDIDEDKDLAGNKMSVLDLGAGGMSSSEEDDDDSSEDEDNNRSQSRRGAASSKKNKKNDDMSSDDSEEEDLSDDDDDESIVQEDDPRNWGKKKSLYYHGDTADLEIGQEEDDAFLEEEAAKEIQASRFEDMDEDDFVLDDDDQDTNKTDIDAKTSSSSTKIIHEKLETIRDTSKLTKKETRKLLDKQYPGK
jgi:U3 small nucleolar RNA-associated protein 3